MATEMVGYRRLYDACGCKLRAQEEFETDLSYTPDLQVHVYLGPKPSLGLTVVKADKFLAPGRVSKVWEFKHVKDPKEAGREKDLFCEIRCMLPVDVHDDLSAAFRRDGAEAHKELLRLAEEHRDALHDAADVISGVLALQFHRQLVLDLLEENYIVLKPDGDYAYNFRGPWLEVLGQVELTDIGIAALRDILEAVGKAGTSAKVFAAKVFRWLLKAWSERDAIDRFIAFFIPIEVILSGQRAGSQTEFRKGAHGLRQLIKKHGGDQRREMLRLVNKLVERQRPSLEERFEDFAREAGMDGWEDDVLAFKEFNQMRNQLLHRGESKVKLSVSITKEVSKQLEDLAIRYSKFALFGISR